MSDPVQEPDKRASRSSASHGLRWKIVAWSFIPTTVFLIAVTIVAYIAYQLATEDMLVERNRDLARLSARQLSSELLGYAELLESASRAPGLTGSSSQVSQAVLETQANRLLVFDAGALLMDSFGEVRASIPYEPSLIGADYSNHRYFRETLRFGQPALSHILPDEFAGKDVVTIAVPVSNADGETLGVLAGMFEVGSSSTSALYGNIIKLHLSDQGSTYVVDPDGRVIYHDDPEYIGNDLSYHEPVLRVESGETNAKRTKGLNNEEILASFATIPGTGWGLILEENWRSLLQEGMRYRTPILALLALGIIIPAIVAAFGAQRITEPLQQLVKASAGVGRGNFEQFIDIQTGDEIEALADQFNNMSNALQDSYAHLEQRVEARTRELSVLLDAVREASSTLDLDQVLGYIARALAEATGAQHCAIYLFDEEDQIFKPTPAGVSTLESRGKSDPAFLLSPIDPRCDALIGEMVARREPVVGRDSSGDESSQDPITNHLAGRSVLAVPFLVKDRLIAAAVIISSGDETAFEQSQIQLAAGIANTAAIAIENADLFREINQRMREVQALYRADEQLYQDLSVDRVFASLQDVAHDILNTDKSCILVYNHERDCLQVQASRGFSLETLEQMDFKPGEGIAGQVLIDHQPIYIESTDAHPQVDRTITDPEGIKAFAHLPITIGDTIFGIFNLSYTNEHTFSNSERRIASALARRSALVIENARLYEAEKRQLEDTERRRKVAEGLQEILSVLNTPRPIDEVFDHIIPLAVQLLSADGGALYKFDFENGRVEAKATFGMPDGFSALESFALDDTPANRATMEGRPYRSPDMRARMKQDGVDPEGVDPESWLGFVLQDFNAFLSVPLMVEGEVFGDITLFYEGAQTFSDEDIQLAMNFARQTALAIENAQFRDRMQRAAVLEERSRLARDLHDSVSQTLFSATLIAEVLPRLWDRDEAEAKRRLQEIRELTRGALAEMRTLLLELRPKALLEAPLPELLEQLCESTIGRARIRVDLEIEGSCSLPDDIKVALYRIAQEALNNVVKHSNASAASVQLNCQAGRALLSIHDNGIGFDPQKITSDHLGLSIMEERADQNDISLDIITSPERGTEVSAAWMGGEEEIEK